MQCNYGKVVVGLTLSIGHIRFRYYDMRFQYTLFSCPVSVIYDFVSNHLFHHTITLTGGGLCWVPDADFSIGRHVYPANCGGDGLQVIELSLTRSYGERELVVYVQYAKIYVLLYEKNI